MGAASKTITTGSVAGILVGLLVMKGYVAPTDADLVTQNLDVFFGAVITIISIASFFAHHIKKLPEQEVEQPKPITPNYTVTTASTSTPDTIVTIPSEATN